MSGGPSKDASLAETRTGQALNAVATVGAANALRMATKEFKHARKLPKGTDPLQPRLPGMPRPKGVAGIKERATESKVLGPIVRNPRKAALIAGGGMLGLHSAEMVGDVIAARTLHRQAQRLKDKEQSAAPDSKRTGPVAKTAYFHKPSPLEEQSGQHQRRRTEAAHQGWRATAAAAGAGSTAALGARYLGSDMAPGLISAGHAYARTRGVPENQATQAADTARRIGVWARPRRGRLLMASAGLAAAATGAGAVARWRRAEVDGMSTDIGRSDAGRRRETVGKSVATAVSLEAAVKGSKLWSQMTPVQRKAAVLSTGGVIATGATGYGAARGMKAAKRNRTDHVLLSEERSASRPVIKADSLPSCLQDLLADVVFMYKQAHLAHWNVTGPNFASMHDFFGDLYSDVYESIDPIAENLRKLGVVVPADALMARSSPFVGSEPGALSAGLLKTNAQVLECLQETFDCADGHDGLQNFLAERIDAHEKWAWQLRSITGSVSKLYSEYKPLGGSKSGRQLVEYRDDDGNRVVYHAGGEIAGSKRVKRFSFGHELPVQRRGVSVSKSMFDPRNGAGRRIVEDDVEKAWNKPKDERTTLFIPGVGPVNGEIRGVRSSGKHRAASAVFSGAQVGALGGVAGLIARNPKLALAGLGVGAGAGAALGYRGSKWGHEFSADPSEIRRVNRTLAADRAERVKQVKKAYPVSPSTHRKLALGTIAAYGGAKGLRKVKQSLGAGDVAKARGYFDPEADRQRRQGLYSGGALGGSIVAAHHAATGDRILPTKEVVLLEDGRKVVRRGLKATKGGAAAAVGAAGLAGLSAHLYRRGTSQRNQPWT